MPNIESKISILTCNQKGKKAAKKFLKQEDGLIKKIDFNAGTFFTHEEVSVSNLQQLGTVLQSLSNEPRRFIIRGKIKEGMGNVVRRKCHEPNAAFDPCPRPYVMLDIDKRTCPEFFNIANNPEQAVGWAVAALPECFRKASCYWQFSASQNVNYQSDEGIKPTISLHLWFWFDREISDQELKHFFKDDSMIDKALFSPVQIHYTARPVFEGMEDPLLIRSGILKKEYDIVVLPAIKMPENNGLKHRTVNEPTVTSDNWNEAIDLLIPYYQKGSRDRFCGAVAGALYRKGWNPENIASFIYELADTAGDEEVNERYGSVFRICDAIDNSRPAQGIPVLKDELGITNLEAILQLLGIGKPDIKTAIVNLDGTKDIDRIRTVIEMLVSIPETEQAAYIDQIRKETQYSKKALNELLKETIELANRKPPVDLVETAMELCLQKVFGGGRLLLRSKDGQYWCYSGRYWETEPENYIDSELRPYAKEIVEASGNNRSLNYIVSGVIKLLPGRVYRKSNPLHSRDTIPSVINCLNGELWINDQGDISFVPHMPESYLQHCLNVEYDPTALSPLFNQTLLEIFANAQDPEGMARHFMELAGYICQPWRKLAKVVFLYGHGRNGKSKLMTIVQNVLSHKMVMSDRISDIEGDAFKIGALDGKLMFLDDDVDEGTLLPDGFLKKISEEKLLTGQHKYKPPFEFVCRALPVMLGNTYPATKDLSDGLRRRMMIIPFLRQFKGSEDKKGLFDEIWKKEASGILNQFIAGFKRLRQRGDFDEPIDCILAKQEWLARSNILPAFIHERCEEDKNYSQALGSFYKEFQHFCEENGNNNTLTQLRFSYRLESLGYDVSTLGGKKVIRGVRTVTQICQSLENQ